MSWSPDGRTLLYTRFSEATGGDIFKLRLGSDEPAEVLVGGPAQENYARFSPDGGWIAYVSDETGVPEVYVRSLAGDVRHQVSQNAGSMPHWSADGRQLFYRVGDRLMALPVTTKPSFRAGAPRVVLGGLGSGWDLSPDGRRVIVVTSAQTPGEARAIHLVLNWFEELKRHAPTP
jgi:serine/threonine-protein kinase